MKYFTFGSTTQESKKEKFINKLVEQLRAKLDENIPEDADKVNFSYTTQTVCIECEKRGGYSKFIRFELKD